MSTTIESEVLRYDRRGIAQLHSAVGVNFCTEAAKALLRTAGPVLIGTGFYIAHAGKPETDGPPGAVALARALEKLGREVHFATDEVCSPMMGRVAEGRPLHVMPLGDAPSIRQLAKSIIDAVKPGMLIAIERCGPDAAGRFLQVTGRDITENTGRLDYLFQYGIPSIGIIDGGNEIGSGKVADIVQTLPGLPDRPCIVPTDRVVLGTVSNWGAYGLLAALSLPAQRALLPSVQEEEELRRATVAAGAVEAFSGEAIPAVDGYPSELNGLVLERLHRVIAGG
ncbi:MAG TPA: glutamate cyclase domain-containing protein [Myxococcaceae bacterium]|nr:glutamate cyclase domain-containing protein [Myxococcaceae bacterium]